LALTNSDGQAARQAAKKFNIPTTFESHLDLIQDSEIDLVVITVRVPHHFDLASAALKAQKSVYCEWPLGRNLAEAVQLAELAKAHKVYGAIGLQSRATPVVNYVKDLIRDGYVGEVLSISVVGSGILWGAALPASFIYTLDPKNGSGMLNVPFAHGLDSVCYALDSQLTEVMAMLGNRRKSVEIVETKEMIPMTIPDQIIIGGKMKNGIFVSIHYRGGLSRGTNFRWEINGTRGDLVVTSSLGYPAVGDATIRGAQDSEPQIHDLTVPESYLDKRAPGGPAQAVFYRYARLAQDLRAGTHLSGTFDDAVILHRVIDAIEASSKNGLRAEVQSTKPQNE
jgi:predicted dehydrogenase